MLTLVINRFFADLFDWHVENSKRGNVQSQFILSHSCHDNPEEEYHWLSLAAENGHVIAQHNMGMYYFYKDPKMAFYWLTKAAAQGSKLSEDRLNFFARHFFSSASIELPEDHFHGNSKMEELKRRNCHAK